MKHINALLNTNQATNLEGLLQTALTRADLPEGTTDGFEVRFLTSY